MNEEKWLACADLNELLGSLDPKHTRRKRRLFSCACCRSIPDVLLDARNVQAINLGEQIADALVSAVAVASLHTAMRVAYHEARVHNLLSLSCLAALAACSCVLSRTAGVATYAAGYAERGMIELGHEPARVRAAQCGFLRDVVGNPFRPVSVDPVWLTSTVLALATGIYQDRAFDRMPILADALQDAGCDNADVLDHCRGSGPHVRGCWLVDLLLGKT